MDILATTWHVDDVLAQTEGLSCFKTAITVNIQEVAYILPSLIHSDGNRFRNTQEEISSTCIYRSVASGLTVSLRIQGEKMTRAKAKTVPINN